MGISLFQPNNRYKIFAVALCVLTFAACTKKNNSKTEETNNQATKSDAIDLAKRSVAMNFIEEPKNMDPQRAADTVGLTILGHSNEGLTRLDPRNKPFPAQAQEWQLKSKTQYVFKIRKGALWNDGKQVTAHDFVYAWQRGLDPKTASEYAFILYPLKNAEKINAGKLTTDKLGVKAIDDLTLEVNLERPVGYFLRLLSFPTYFPTRKDYVEKYADKYAADADKLPYNGPFTISQWTHNSSLTLTKNQNYWNASNIWLNEIRMPYLIRDENSEFNMFKDGKFAFVRTITKELLPNAQKNKMQIRKYNTGAVWYFQLNNKRKITGNKNFRKALQAAMNRAEYVKQVNGIPGNKPAFALIPSYMPGVNATYGEEYPVAFEDGNVTLAKQYLEKAKKELGIEKFPPLNVLASEAETVRRDMQYFQRYFKETLGLDFQLDFQTFKVRLERSDRGDFDLVNSGWGPDYLDAMTFADLFASWNKNNNTGWTSKKYDDLVKKAMNSIDAKERLDAMAEANGILVDEAPIVPYFEQARVYVQNPQLIGLIRRTVGPDPDFYYAKIAEPVANKK